MHCSLVRSLSECHRLRTFDVEFLGIDSSNRYESSHTVKKTLELTGSNISSLPESLSHCTSLEQFNAVGCNIASLPVRVWTMFSYEWNGSIQYGFGLFTTIYRDDDTSLNDFISIVVLNRLPDDISDCSSLELLDVSDNKILYLPSSMDNLTRLSTLSLLQMSWLDSGNFKFGDIFNRTRFVGKSTIAGLELVGKLFRLQNSIWQTARWQPYPDKCFTWLQLEELVLRHNELTQFPSTFPKSSNWKVWMYPTTTSDW